MCGIGKDLGRNGDGIRRKLICLGDSLTFGAGVTRRDCWTSLVQRECGWTVVNETAVKNLFCNSYLLLILLVGIGMISIYDYCRIFQIFLLIFFQEETEIFVMIIWNSFSVFIDCTPENGMSKFIACGFHFPASVNKTMSTLCCYHRVEHNR